MAVLQNDVPLLCSVARVTHFLYRTHVTLDVTAPVEGARAALPHDESLRGVAPPAAHEVASIDTEGGLIALAPFGAMVTEGDVMFAKCRRTLKIHQVAAARFLVVDVRRTEVEAF